MRFIRGLVLSSLTLLAFTACTSTINEVVDDGGGSGIPTMNGPPELGYCATSGSYSPSVTVSGTAKYVRREIFGTAMGSVGAAGLGSASLTDPSHPAHAYPIRYAEVRVTNGAGTLIQCTETDGSGNYSVALPQGNVNYTVSVMSRSFNSHLHASVLNSPDSNTVYAVTATVNALSSTSGLDIVATANGALLGGAFNILDQILNANEYLVSQVGTCSGKFTGCTNYDPTAFKISAYWKKGFNPNDYFGTGNSGLSFYLPGYKRLFILGGVNGDTDNSDTDHFDNSIIIHEYGHFLEDTWFRTDSPGGAHDGDSIIDPRLAWSEGWGDFIQAAVRGDSHYIDTMGNVDGTTELIYYANVETTAASPSSDAFDFTNHIGEGNFREFAVTRLLWDTIDDTASETDTFTDVYTGTTYTSVPDDVKNAFSEIWASLTKATNGYRDSRFAFRNVGLVHLAQTWMHNNKAAGGDSFASDWSNVRTLNRHIGDTTRYGQALIPSGALASNTNITSVSASCSGGSSAVPGNAPSGGTSGKYYFTLTPRNSSGDTGSLSTSNLFANNRFYHLKIGSSPFATAGTHTLQLRYEDHDHTANLTDMDLYLYNEDARFGVSNDIIAMSRLNPSGGATAVQTEAVTVSLPAGDYLINVNVYTGGSLGTQADFNLVLDGVVLCPYDLVQ